MRISLTKKQYEVLLDEFLLNPELECIVRRWPYTDKYDFKRHCFDYALSGQPVEMIQNPTEYTITVMAKYLLIGHQLGLDIDSGVSERYKKEA